MKTFLIFAIFSLSTAQAADALFLRVLSRLNNDGVLPQQSLACQAGGQNAEFAQACAVQLCGDSHSAPTVYITDARIEEWTKPEVMARFSEIEESLKKIIDSNNQKNRTALANLRKRIAAGNLAIGKDTDQEGYDKIADAYFEILLNPDFDLEKPLSERFKTSVVQIPSHTPEIKAALQSYAAAYSENLKKDFTNACYMGVYSPNEAKEELKRRFDLFDARLQAALKMNPQLLAENKEQIEKIRSEVNSGEEVDLEVIGEGSAYLTYFDNLLARATSQDQLWPPIDSNKCKSDVCKRGVSALVAQGDWKKLADEMEARLNDPQLAQQQLNYCRSNFASLSLKDSESQRIREALPRVRTQFMARVAKKFSTHSREAFEKYLNENLSYNFASDEYEPLDEYIKKVNDRADDTEQDDVASSAGLFQRLLKIKDPYSDMLNLVTDADCGGYGATAWDSFMPVQPGNEEWVPSDGDPTKDNVQISHFSCTHPAQGEQILAHELGHALSQAFSDKELSESSYVEFMRMRECVNGWADPNVPELAMSFVQHEGDFMRTEEDNADLVAYMFAHDNPALMSCALLQPELSGNGYVSPSITNIHLFDSHSSPLTRAIREAMHKRLPLPAACQQLIGPESSMRFNTCF